MEPKELIDLIYRVEEECFEFLKKHKGNNEEVLSFIEKELSSGKKNENLQDAKSLYEKFLELGLNGRNDVSDFVLAYGQSLLAKGDKDGAVFCFELASDYGGTKAKIAYAKALIDGTCGITSVEEGIDILRGLADKDVPEACYLLYLYHGLFPGVVEGPEAKKAYEKAAILGYSQAFEPLPDDFDARPYLEVLQSKYEQGDKSVCHELYEQTALPDQVRINYLLEAGDLGDPKALEEMGRFHEEAGEVDKAIECFVSSGEHGNPHAYLYAAELIGANPHFYEKVKGPWSREQIEEFGYYERAAEGGDPYALTKVGYAYQRGIVVATDKKKGFALLLKADELGESYEASYLIGISYLNGIGIRKNASKALPYLKQAASKGNLLAMKELMALCPEEATRYRFMMGLDRD